MTKITKIKNIFIYKVFIIINKINLINLNL